MQRTAKLHFALDINDLAAAHAHLRGDPRRIAEGKRAEADYRKPIDLADHLAVGFDADRLAADLFLHAAVDAITAADLRVDRGLHLNRAGYLLATIGGELIGFLQQFDDHPHAGREPV